MLCLKCEGPMKKLAGKSSGKREVWGCRKAGCSYKEEVKLWTKPVSMVVEEEFEEVEKEVREALGCDRDDVDEEGESVVDFLTQLDEDERSREMAKKSAGLGSVVSDDKEAKKAAMKAKAAEKKAAKAKEVEEFTQGRATKTKGARAAVKKEVVKAAPADCPLCPCCGERTGSPKSYFLMGHDGRVKGWFTKKAKGKLPDEVKLSEELEKMYKLWKKGEGATIKEIVMKVRGIK